MITNKRIFELDFLRGCAVIAMVFDHFTYLLSEISYFLFDLFSNVSVVNTIWFDNLIDLSTIFQYSAFRNICHYIFVTIFLLISGISSSFSKNNFKRGIKVGIGALIITLVMFIFSLITNSDYNIIFGILHVIAVSIIIFSIVQKIYPNKWLYLSIGCFFIIWGFIIEWYKAPYFFELDFFKLIKVILGYNCYGADHFGIVPHTGFFFVGAFLGELLYKERKTLLPTLDSKWHTPISFVGRHALIVYLLHQAVSVIIIFIMCLIAGYRL